MILDVVTDSEEGTFQSLTWLLVMVAHVFLVFIVASIPLAIVRATQCRGNFNDSLRVMST